MLRYEQLETKLGDVVDGISDAAIAELVRQHEAAVKRLDALREYDVLKYQVEQMEKAQKLVVAQPENPTSMHSHRFCAIESGVSHEELRALALERLRQKLADQRTAINEMVRAEVSK